MWGKFFAISIIFYAGLAGANTCVGDVNEVSNSISEASMNSELSVDDAKSLIERSFETRLQLKNKHTDLYKSQSLTLECSNAIRRALQVMRSAEETVLINQLRQNKIQVIESKKSNETLIGDYPQTIKNSKFYDQSQDVELKSGDILLMRGIAVVSALIAKIGDEDAMFSHIGVFYIHPETQKKYIIESLIETGSKITPFDEWMKIVEARVAVYRYANESVAQDAAQKLYEFLKNKTIPYDFSMNMSDYNKMFCSEVVRLGFELATDGNYKLPTFMTTANHIEASDYLKQLGIKSSNFFSPNDIELEPDFELVAEFRRIDRLNSLKKYDLSMQSIFDWMSFYNYKLKVSAFNVLKNKFGKLIDNIGLKDYGIPKGMPAKTIETMALTRVLQKDVLLNQLEIFEKEYLAQNNKLPTEMDLLNHLNEFRKKDCLSYKNRNTNKSETVFHHFFRPDDLVCE